MINGRHAGRVASTEAAMRAEGLSVLGVVGSMDAEAGVAILTDQAIDAFGRIDLSSAPWVAPPIHSRSRPSVRNSSSRRSDSIPGPQLP